ncbi:hypothetical protein D3C78_1302420 [compost metagenome]
MPAVRIAFGLQRTDQLGAQVFGIGMGEVDVGDMIQLAFVEGVLAPPGVVDQLVRHAEVPGAHGGMNAAHRIDRDDRLGTGLLQRPQVGPIVDLVRRDAMRMTVTGEEQHLATAELAAQDVGRRRAIGRFQRYCFADAESFELGQPGSADDCYHCHCVLLIQPVRPSVMRPALRASAAGPDNPVPASAVRACRPAAARG